VAGCNPQTQEKLHTFDCESIIQQLQEKVKAFDEDRDDYFTDYAWLNDYLALLIRYRDTQQIEWNDESTHAFLMASALGHIDVVKWLLSEGIDVNAKEERHHTTALMFALSDIDMVKVLLAAGADVNAREWYGFTALSLAKHPEIIALLRKAGAEE